MHTVRDPGFFQTYLLERGKRKKGVTLPVGQDGKKGGQPQWVSAAGQCGAKGGIISQ